MNATTTFFRRMHWLLALTTIALIGTLVLGACTTPTVVPPIAVPSTPTASIVVKSIADDIATDVGQVTQIAEGDPNRIVIVFEEIHGSPAGQVEIAIMLNRLYERYGMRNIGLEANFVTEGNLNAAWFDPSFTAGQPIREREDVIVQLLEGGEISSSEMMALTYADVAVAGIENADEYNYEPPDEAWSAPTIYLYLIAAPGLTQDEIAKVNPLIDADKILEAIEFIISTDEWTSEKYALINDETIILSAEDWLQILDDIEAKAVEVGADITSEETESLQSLREFYQKASDRSRTMVGYVLELSGKSSGAPVAMITGAAHTELVAQLLTQEGVSFAVIRGNSLAENRENGDLHYQAYERKTLSQSVDPAGTLGALLDGRKKPRPVISEVWFQRKAYIFGAVNLLALAASRGEAPPFTSALSALPPFEGVTINQDSFRMDGDDLILSFTTSDRNGKSLTVWVRARANLVLAKTLEERLFEAHDHIQSEDAPNNDVDEPISYAPVLTRISSETVAKFATSEADIITATLEK